MICKHCGYEIELEHGRISWSLTYAQYNKLGGDSSVVLFYRCGINGAHEPIKKEDNFNKLYLRLK